MKKLPVASFLNCRLTRQVWGKRSRLATTSPPSADPTVRHIGRSWRESRTTEHWRVDNLASFDEFLEMKLPEFRRKAYELMATHEQVPRRVHLESSDMGWTKVGVLVKATCGEGRNFTCATWVHKARRCDRKSRYPLQVGVSSKSIPTLRHLRSASEAMDERNDAH
jgi:hypothetical protein